MTQLISIVASLCNFSSGASYFKQLIKNESTPNPTTWLIWVVVTIINAATYFFVVKGSIWIFLASAVMATVIFIIFVTALFKGKFTRINIVDAIFLVLAIVIGIFWKISGNAVVSNVCLQIIFLISFYPTLNGLLIKRAKEKPMPWFFALGSYILQVVNVLINPITLWALVFPIVNGIGNGIIGFVAYYQNKIESENQLAT